MKSGFRQCTLQRIIPAGEPHHPATLQQVAWIPSRFAVVGKLLRIGGVEGWEVLGVGETELPQPPHAEGLIRGHEKRTGDAMSKLPKP